MELTTIPFHLSFQRMLDLLRVPKHESGSLTAMLTNLQERVRAAEPATEFTATQREVIQALRIILQLGVDRALGKTRVKPSAARSA